MITTVAGDGNFATTGDGGPAAMAQVNNPYGGATDAAGNFYFEDTDYSIGLFGSTRIRKIDAGTGIITTVVGGGIHAYPNDGFLATDADIGVLPAFAVDPAGNIYFGDSGPNGPLLRRVDATAGSLSTIAGGGAAASGYTIHPVVPWISNRIVTINGVPTYAHAVAGQIGDGGPAIAASLGGLGTQPSAGGPITPFSYGVASIAVDADSNIYISIDFRVRRIDAVTGIITTVAGSGAARWAYFGGQPISPGGAVLTGVTSGDEGLATAAGCSPSWGLTVDPAGNIYFTDLETYNDPDYSQYDQQNPPPSGPIPLPLTTLRIRRIDAGTGIIHTLGGNNGYGSDGDGGPFADAQFGSIIDTLSLDPACNLYFNDPDNGVVRRVDALTQVITTIAGTPGQFGFDGDGGPASLALLSDYVGGVAADRFGNLYLSDWDNARIRKVSGLLPNSPPTADAGPDQSIHASGIVYLDGSASFDDNTASANLQFEWTLAAKPAGSLAVLSGAMMATPTFVVDLPGTYVADLVVRDAEGLESLHDQVIVASTNLAPSADAGPDRGSYIGQQIDLSAAGSSDPENDPLSVFWAFLQVPAGSNAVLVGNLDVLCSFIPDLEGTYVVGLLVDDGFGPSPIDEVVVTIVTGTKYVENVAMDSIALVNDLPVTSVTNAGNQTTLTKYLAQTAQQVQSGNLAAGRQKLEMAISRTDGCALRGSPDLSGAGRDWVTTCAEQQQLYADLVAALAALGN